jgi:hypothetical protein
MSALENIARRGACAVATATLLPFVAGAQVLSSHRSARVDEVGLSLQGDKLEFAVGDIEFAIEPTWTVSYAESAELNCATPHSLVWVTFTSRKPGNPARPECIAGRATTTLRRPPLGRAWSGRHLSSGQPRAAVPGSSRLSRWRSRVMPSASASRHLRSLGDRPAVRCLHSPPWRHDLTRERGQHPATTRPGSRSSGPVASRLSA